MSEESGGALPSRELWRRPMRLTQHIDEEKSERTRSERIESSDAAIELRACSMESARAVEAIELRKKAVQV